MIEANTVDASRLATKGRRYGELDQPSQILVTADSHQITIPEPLPEDLRYNEQSYEEWKVNSLIDAGKMTSESPDYQFSYMNRFVGMLKGSKSMVEVSVGTDATSWNIHENLLCSSSTFFKTALNSPFKEAMERKVTLPEDSTAVFELFVQFLYCKTFDSPFLLRICEAYVMGDKFGASEFQALALDKLFTLSKTDCQFSAGEVLWVLENSFGGSALRALVLDIVALAILRKRLEFSEDGWEILTPFLPELMQAVVSVSRDQPDRDRDEWVRKPRLAYMDLRINQTHAGPFTLRPFSGVKNAEKPVEGGDVKTKMFSFGC